MVTKAAIYARYSSQKQQETSIDDQVRVCREYCRRNGMRVVGVYTDSAKTGRDDNRPGFQLAISEAEKYDVLVVYKTDRFARNRYDALYNKGLLKKRGAVLESATETFPDGPEGIIVEGLIDAMNEFYSANLSQNVTRGMESGAMRCRVLGPIPYGYRKGPDGCYEVVEEEAAVIRRMFELRVSDEPGTSFYRDIERITDSKGRPLSYNRALKWIKNPAYKGTYRWRDIVVEGGVPAIVSPNVWEEAQKPRNRRRRVSEEEYYLTGKLFGDGMSRATVDSTTNRHGTTYRYYVVNGSRVRKEALEERVGSVIADSVTDSLLEEVMEAVRAANEAAESMPDPSEAAQRQLDEVRKQKSNIVAAIASMGPDRAFDDKLRELRAEEERLESVILESCSDEPLTIDEDAVAFCLEQWVKPGNEQYLIRCFLHRCVLSSDGELTCWFSWGGETSDGWPEEAVEKEEPAAGCAGSNDAEWWAVGSSIRISRHGLELSTRLL